MPLLSYEGVSVEIPTALDGIQFNFMNGTLTIQCRGFTGDIVLGKPTAKQAVVTTASMSLADFPSVGSSTATTKTKPKIKSTPPAKKRALASALPSGAADSSSGTDAGDSDSDLARKRLRPNFLNDVEQSMLLAQMDTSQQGSASSEMDVLGPATLSSSMVASSQAESDAEKENANSSANIQPAASQKATIKSPATAKDPRVVTASAKANSFFSPEPKELASKKRVLPKLKNKTDTAVSTLPPQQPSIRDMMARVTLPPPKSTKPAKAALSTVQAAVSTPSVAVSPSAIWSTVATHGTPPMERWAHSVTAISEDRVVVYGGADDDENTLGDLHVFDMQAQSWSRPLNCESILRAWHDAVFLASKKLLLVLGGERAVGDDQTEVLSDIMVLDTDCFLWYPPAISGVAPTARSGHTCTAVGSDIVVFGGSRGRSRQSSVHVLDCDNWHWKTIKVEGKPPSARTYHSAVTVGDSVIYFGGNDAKKSFNSVHVLKKCSGGAKDKTTGPSSGSANLGKDKDKDKNVWTWFHPCVVGNPPCPRTGHSAMLVDDSKILIFGGWDPQTEVQGQEGNVFNDAFELNTDSWEWEQVQITDPSAFPGRVGHGVAMAPNGKSVLLFGGQNGSDQRMNTIHSLTLTASAGAVKATAVATTASALARPEPTSTQESVRNVRE